MINTADCPVEAKNCNYYYRFLFTSSTTFHWLLQCLEINPDKCSVDIRISIGMMKCWLYDQFDR